MKADIRKPVYWLIVCVVVIFFSVMMAHYIERDFGRVDVQFIRIVDDTGTNISGKLFRPTSVTTQNKAPGVLNLHGGNNDKDTQDPVSIELARHGFVVVAVDAYGQGDSQGLQDVGQVFGNPAYTQGRDSGYLFLKNLPFVDANNLGIVGHSMGGIDAFKIAALNPDVKGLVSLDGEMLVMAPVNTNVLYVKDTWSDMTPGAPPLPTVNPALCRQTSPLIWETTYGDFSDLTE
jgi:pimeloyl-ACP methyl ester carboxylesterase